VAIEIKLPQYGMTMHEATIARWLKAVDEQVEEGEPLLEVETDKMTVEVPAPVSGRLARIDAEEGETVDVLATIGLIE
jgi:2-oxoglutarate dehydrogenase E2 component (dihydrolipoamide succinyltransferase)